MESVKKDSSIRTKSNVQVHFKPTYSRVKYPGTIINISSTGAFLNCADAEAFPKARISITLAIAGNARTLLAEVIWRNNSGIGIKFIPKSMRDNYIIDDIREYSENIITEKHQHMATVLNRVYSSNLKK